ncbi:MAG: hypothetical protein FWD96_05525, partial [Defluviitaleaceae bacterium]|nr:hypothetical protein [Defluviitaleaceae bacterium]
HDVFAAGSRSGVPPWLRAADTSQIGVNDPRVDSPSLGGRYSRWSSFNSANLNIRNAGSLVSTAANALTEVNLMLNTARQLTQIAAETSNISDRQRIQNDINAILEQIDTIQSNSARRIGQTIHGANAENFAMSAGASRSVAQPDALGASPSLPYRPTDPDDLPYYYVDSNWPTSLHGVTGTIMGAISIMDDIYREYWDIRGRHEHGVDPDSEADDLARVDVLARTLLEATEALDDAFRMFIDRARAILEHSENEGYINSADRDMFYYSIETFIDHSGGQFYNRNYIETVRAGVDGRAPDGAGDPGMLGAREAVVDGNFEGAIDGLHFALFGDTRQGVAGFLDHGTHGVNSAYGGLTGVILHIVRHTSDAMQINPETPGGAVSPPGVNPPELPELPVLPQWPYPPPEPPADPTVSPPANPIQPPYVDVEPPRREVAGSIYFQVGVNQGDGWWLELVEVNSDTLALRDEAGNSAINIMDVDSISNAANLQRLDNAISFVLAERAYLMSAQSRLNADNFMVNVQESQLNLQQPEIVNQGRSREVDMEAFERTRRMLLLQWLAENASRGGNPMNNDENNPPGIPGFVRPQPPGQ